MDFDEARDENWEPAPDWTEYDERVLQESWEMDSEPYHLTWEEEDWLSREPIEFLTENGNTILEDSNEAT